MSLVIDVHTHMFSQDYLDLVAEKGAPKYTLGKNKGGQDAIFAYGAPYVTLFPEMIDYAKRIENMDKAGVDIAIVSLTAQNCYFGGPEVSLKAAQLVNDDMAYQQTLYPDRIRWFTSLPWQYPELALQELDRTVNQSSAVGVYVAANIDGLNLTDPMFVPIWDKIDEMGLPVLVHPTAPKGSADMDLDEYGLVPPIGFMFDTTLAIARMVLDGFFERYQNMKVIASHGGATLPYLAGRLDRCHEMIPDCREKITKKPSEYLRNVYYDAVVYTQEALQLCVDQMGEDNVMYGSDYPHNIGHMEGTLSRVNALDERVKHKVRGDNAERIFNL